MKWLFALPLIFLVACSPVALVEETEEIPTSDEVLYNTDLRESVFAGGCFWCMESPFEKLDGVSEVISGYAGGTTENPTYKEVSGGGTGHAEAVRVVYDPTKVTYEELLFVFWQQINPTDAGGQFVDRGTEYRSAIFYKTDAERRAAERTKEQLEELGIFGDPIVTEITAFTNFYDAEEYHQDYYKNNPVRYNFYRSRSGRDQYLKPIWTEETIQLVKDALLPYTKASDEELRERLTPLQYKVTQEDGTERAFDNEYWDNKEEGIYVDIVSGEPLFSSTDKFVSGTGWPSFTKPLEPSNIVTKDDFKLVRKRIEVRSKHADSHLGHLFNDGPGPTGLRYCMNSAALRFIPKDQLEAEGFGQYLELFE